MWVSTHEHRGRGCLGVSGAVLRGADGQVSSRTTATPVLEAMLSTSAESDAGCEWMRKTLPSDAPPDTCTLKRKVPPAPLPVADDAGGAVERGAVPLPFAIPEGASASETAREGGCEGGREGGCEGGCEPVWLPPRAAETPNSPRHPSCTAEAVARVAVA